MGIDNSLPAIPVVAGISTVVVVSLAIFIRYVASRRSREDSPDDDEYERIGKVSELLIFPVKSGRHIAMDQAECRIVGLCHPVNKVQDRHWHLVDEDKGLLFNMNSAAKMIFVQPSGTEKNNGGITLSAKGMSSSVTVDIPPKTARKVEIWQYGLTTSGLDCGEEAAKWWRTFLGTGDRKITMLYVTPDEQMEASIFRPLLVHTRAAIDELSQRLNGQFPSGRNFRANITVSGCPAFDEDNWDYMRIGDSVWKGVEPCIRCGITTIDEDIGKKDHHFEPFNILKSYRLLNVHDKQPVFGRYFNLVSRPGSKINIDDDVYVTRRKKGFEKGYVLPKKQSKD